MMATMRLDYHIHTLFSDGRKDFSDYVDEAVKRKIDEIGFSDHIYFKKAAWSMDSDNLPVYVNRINALRETSRISIKMGLEVDYVPFKMDGLIRKINEFNFDYLMGSVHFVGDWLIDDDRQIQEWKRRDVDQVNQQYFKLVQNMADSGLFDVVGHLDLVKKFNFQPKNDITGLLLETVEVISENGTCIEVNTGGLRKPCHEVYPSEKLLKMCFDHGVAVTLGSDAHAPEEVGSDLDKAVDLLRRVGYVEKVRFTKRNKEFVEL